MMPAEITCQVCGNVFVGRVGTKYCCKECYRKASEQKRKQADSIFPDRCLESAIKAVKACDEETVSRLTSILATNDRYSMSKLKMGWVQSGPSFKGRVCEVCGRKFNANSSTQKYCSRECVKLAKKRKQITTKDRHTEAARIAVGGLSNEARTRLAHLMGVDD
jgi:hypothetical protein